MEKAAEHEEKMLALNPLSAAEYAAWRQWIGLLPAAPSSSSGKWRKRKKRRKKRLPKSSSSRAVRTRIPRHVPTSPSSGSCSVSTCCQRSLPCDAWVHSGCIRMPWFWRLMWKNFTHFLCARAVRTWFLTLFLQSPHILQSLVRCQHCLRSRRISPQTIFVTFNVPGSQTGLSLCAKPQLLFVMPRLYDLGPTVSHLDSCGSGSRFRRRTTFLCWNLDIPAVLPTCYPHGNMCSFSELVHQKFKLRPLKSARAAGNLSYPWRLRESITSWFLSTWEQNALGYRWSSCRHSIPEYRDSGSIIQ